MNMKLGGFAVAVGVAAATSALAADPIKIGVPVGLSGANRQGDRVGVL